MKRTYAEEIVNALTHFLWLIFSLVVLIWSMLRGHDGLVLHSFGSFLVALGSTMYHKHGNDDQQGKQALRRLDKICIFLFMGFVALSFGFAQGSSLLILSFFVMLISLIVSVLYSMNIIKEVASENYSKILAIGALMTSLHVLCPWHFNAKTSMTFVLGLTSYALGYYFYSKDEESKWMHSAWHIMVMIGWAFHCATLIYFSTQ